jgi:hypothetical protein
MRRLASWRVVTRYDRRLVEVAAEDGGDLLDFGHEFGVFGGDDGLDAVGEGFVRLMMDFDEEAISADGDCCTREGEDFVALAGAVGGIDEDREVAALFDCRDDGEIKSVAGEVREGTDTAFAEHHVVVALGEDVFGGHKEFVKRGRHAALQEDGKFGAASSLEQREVLHVTRTDLNDVGVLLDEVEGFVVDGLGDDAETVFLPNHGEDFQTGQAESLKRVGRSAGLVGTAAKEAGAGGLQLFGNGEALLLCFDSAGAGNHGDVPSANEDVPGRSRDFDDRVLFLHIARNELVGLGNRNAFDDAGHGLEGAEVDGAGIAGDTDGGATGAGNGVGFQAEGFDAFADGTNLFFSGVRLHDDKHVGPRV